MHTPERKLAASRDSLRTVYNELNSLPALSKNASPTTRQTRLALYQDAHNIVDDIAGILTIRSKPSAVMEKEALPITETEEALPVVLTPAEKRYNDEIRNHWNGCHLSAKDFRTILLDYPPSGSLAACEITAITRLVKGFRVGGEVWQSQLDDIVVSRSTLNAFCVRAREISSVEDPVTRLVQLDQSINNQFKSSAADQFVHYVIRTVQTLRFMFDWQNHTSGPGSRKYKTSVISASFAAMYPRTQAKLVAGDEKAKEDLEKYRRKHQTMIEGRQRVLKWYMRFGPAILLDRFWDPDNETRGIRRSGTFHELMDIVCEADVRRREDKNVHCAEWNYCLAADALYRILEILASTEVADFVEEFLEEHPPIIPDGYEYGWGKHDDD